MPGHCGDMLGAVMPHPQPAHQQRTRPLYGSELSLRFGAPWRRKVVLTRLRDVLMARGHTSSLATLG